MKKLSNNWKSFLITASLLGAAYGQTHAAGLTFLPKTVTASGEIDQSKAVCVYLKNGYRPVTPLAVKAVMAVNGSTCNQKAEAVLHAKSKQFFVKHNKKTLGEARYNEILKRYYEHLAK